MSDPNAAGKTSDGQRNLLALLFAGFVLSGIATTVLGPMLPIFIKRWALNDAQAGLFPTVQFLCALGATLASSVLAAWKGYRLPLVLGYALMGGGLAFLNAATHGVAIGATAAFGLGYGLITPGTNLFVAELGGGKSASLLNQLNFAWGAGAMACSPLIAVALKRNGLGTLLMGTAVFGAVLVIGLLSVPFEAHKHEEKKTAEAKSPLPVGIAVTIALAFLFFIYVAMENGLGVWSAEYAKRLANGITELTTLVPMFFYAGLTVGRASAPLVLHRFNEGKIVLCALALAAAGMGALLAAHTVPLAVAGIFTAGLGCASVYPIYIAWLSRWYGASAKKIGGFLFALGSLGASVAPGLIGTVSQYSGSLRIGLLLPFSGALVMIGIVLGLRRRTAA
jgi:FHS family glucose/mannose:H+ symporter-like MFS transporter